MHIGDIVDLQRHNDLGGLGERTRESRVIALYPFYALCEREKRQGYKYKECVAVERKDTHMNMKSRQGTHKLNWKD